MIQSNGCDFRGSVLCYRTGCGGRLHLIFTMTFHVSLQNQCMVLRQFTCNPTSVVSVSRAVNFTVLQWSHIPIALCSYYEL